MKSVAKELEAFRASLMRRIDPKTGELLRRHEASLLEAGFAERAPKVGETAPDFTLPDTEGRNVRLHAVLDEGSVVLTFFRGGWCPYCAIALRGLQAIEPELQALGASLLAVTPQASAESLAMAERDGLRFPILHDRENRVALSWGIAYELCPTLRPFYERMDHPLPRVNQCTDWTAPAPATFVIGGDRRIALAHVDPRSHVWLEPAAALDAVRGLADRT